VPAWGYARLHGSHRSIEQASPLQTRIKSGRARVETRERGDDLTLLPRFGSGLGLGLSSAWCVSTFKSVRISIYVYLLARRGRRRRRSSIGDSKGGRDGSELPSTDGNADVLCWGLRRDTRA
jgi:hypothetical protein